jgi:ElaB/YqjD/DUF883 family membrane-anchored ribosome-binding protein
MEYPEIQQHVDDLKDDLSRLKTDMAEVVRTMMEAGKIEAGEAREKLEAKARAQLDALSAQMAGARQRGRVAYDAMHHKIEANPLASVAIAAGAGFMLGFLVSRK